MTRAEIVPRKDEAVYDWLLRLKILRTQDKWEDIDPVHKFKLILLYKGAMAGDGQVLSSLNRLLNQSLLTKLKGAMSFIIGGRDYSDLVK